MAEVINPDLEFKPSDVSMSDGHAMTPALQINASSDASEPLWSKNRFPKSSHEDSEARSRGWNVNRGRSAALLSADVPAMASMARRALRSSRHAKMISENR